MSVCVCGARSHTHAKAFAWNKMKLISTWSRSGFYRAPIRAVYTAVISTRYTFLRGDCEIHPRNKYVVRLLAGALFYISLCQWANLQPNIGAQGSHQSRIYGCHIR